MTSFISGLILQVHLDPVTGSKNLQNLVDTVTYWKIENVLNIDSDNDQNIHWTRGRTFSILLDPSWVQGLDLNDTDIANLRLERTVNFESSTESWRVI